MRPFAVLAALAVLLVSCITPDATRTGTPAPSPTARTASPAPAAVLTKLSIAAKLGEQAIRVSPNGEMVLVVELAGFVHTVYDLSGRSLTSLKLGEIGMNPFWLPDSSGVAVGRRVDREAGGDYVLDVSILELDGTVREVARRVTYPRAEAQLVSPDGQSLAFDTPCCPSSVVVAGRRGGTPARVATAQTQLRVLSWDAQAHVVYWAGGDAIDAVGVDGSRYRVPLGLPSGVRAVDVWPGVRTGDAVATVLAIKADGAFPGAAAQTNTADRTLVGGELRAYPSGAPTHMRLSDHQVLTYTRGGALRAYDITTGITYPMATINDGDGVSPTAFSARTLMSSPGRTWVRVLDVDRDVEWHATEVGRVLRTEGYALSRARFLVFDEDGAPYVLDGAAARAAPARPALSATVNAVAGTVRVARNAVVGRKMELVWRMPDGAPQSLEYLGASLVVVALWKRACAVCTQGLGVISDVANGTRTRIEIIAVGVDETESAAVEVARDYRQLRPLVGSRTVLMDLAPDLLPQTIILDSDHVVREVIVGELTWEALVRALTAASKSRLALRDRDVALS